MISTLFQNPIVFFIYIVALLVAISVHEFSHAFTAEKLGDPTPRLQKRITLNPLAHIDLYGLLFLFFVGFGWGKPVVFDPFNLKNPRRDAAIISLAGPLSNFILAIVLAITLRLFILIDFPFLQTIGLILFIPLIQLNIILGVFNLLPIHPLDGFKVVGGMLSPEKAHEWYQLERYGYLFLIFLIIPFFGNHSMIDVFLRPVTGFIFHLLIPQFSTSGII